MTLNVNEHTKPLPFISFFQKSTTVPLFVHPKRWSESHLNILRVSGLDAVHSLDKVIGKELDLDPAENEDFQLVSSKNDAEKTYESLGSQLSVFQIESHDCMKTPTDVEEDVEGVEERLACVEQQVLFLHRGWYDRINEMIGGNQGLCQWRWRYCKCYKLFGSN